MQVVYGFEEDKDIKEVKEIKVMGLLSEQVELDKSRIYFEINSGKVLKTDIDKIEDAWDIIEMNEYIRVFHDNNDVPDQLVFMKS